MRAADQAEYIVQCIRDAASMYEKDARAFLAEHDAHVRAETLRNAVDSVTGIHQNCHRNRDVCAGCQVRADILDVLTSVADVLGEKATAPAATATPDRTEGGDAR